MKLLKCLVVAILFLSTVVHADSKNELLFYVGITMVKPVNELAKNFEKANNCTIKILQGGSQDLYDSAKASQVGDLYLPGSVSYRDKLLKEGLLLDGKFVGYNKLSLVVKKGNPKNIKASLSELTNDKLNVVLGNEQSDVIVNILSGKIMLTYKDIDENQIANLLTKVEVELVVEIIKNGVKTVKTILMDNKLGIEGKNYRLSITSDDFKNIEIKYLNVHVNNIIEVEIYKVLKDNQ